jgi:hypothetical protein
MICQKKKKMIINDVSHGTLWIYDDVWLDIFKKKSKVWPQQGCHVTSSRLPAFWKLYVNYCLLLPKMCFFQNECDHIYKCTVDYMCLKLIYFVINKF